MIYVDKAIYRYRGQLWCHLAANTIAELCSAAIKLGLRREWFQHPPKASWPHYDLSTHTQSLRIETWSPGDRPT